MLKRKFLKFIFLIFFVSCPRFLSAQLTYGQTGLLHMPSAEMQRDKTVMIGANFLNKAATPAPWSYNTYNYYLNATLFPWMEVTYTMTLFKGKTLGLNTKHFTNQDRYFSVRFRLLKEGQLWKYMPAIVVGTTDPYTESDSGQINNADGNGYFCRFYIAATKHLQIGSEEIGFHLAYLYNRRKSYHYNGPAFGISYAPSVLPQLTLIAEHDSRDISMGMTYLLFNHLHAQIQMQRMSKFTGGLAYKIYLK